MPAGVPGAVLQKVRERALELRGVGPDQREVRVDGEAELRRPAGLLGGGTQDLVDRAPVRPGGNR